MKYNTIKRNTQKEKTPLSLVVDLVSYSESEGEWPSSYTILFRSILLPNWRAWKLQNKEFLTAHHAYIAPFSAKVAEPQPNMCGTQR